MNLTDLLNLLDYAKSLNYRSIEDCGSIFLGSHVFRAIERMGVKGTYVFHTSPEDKILPVKPAVFIAEAKTEDEARTIHRKLWNFGIAPFLMVLLPHQIRIYTGFDYNHKQDNVGLINQIEIVDIEDVELKNKLQDFSSFSIDSGNIWEKQSNNLDPQKRVDTHLLNNLEKLEKVLLDKKIELPIIHSLIGKYIYIRYLNDRNILSKKWQEENNLSLDNILSRNANLESLSRLVDLLEQRFNGCIFPFPNNANNVLTDDIVSLVASVFKGDDPKSGQLHLDFEPYDFSLIPVEVLSSIYEQFLHASGEGKKVGAIYTPEPVADYLLCEINSVKPLEKGMKVLDPCCGSGIFLVLAYRRLIELELTKTSDKKLDAKKLLEILSESIYGVERNQDACYVAEFSLILTMLNYIDANDLQMDREFRFPSLHNVNIYKADLFDDESSFWKKNLKFDWIVGNPPWGDISSNNEREKFVLGWIKKNSETYPVSGNRVSEAVSWRVIDVISEAGYVGLFNHATTLVNHNAEKYRKEFFTKNTVFRITNFSNLARILFHKKSTVSASTVVYRKSKQKEEKPFITHYGPFLINQLPARACHKGRNKNTWVIIINESEIENVNPKDAETGKSIVWKLALWGNYRDKKAIKKLERFFKSRLSEFEDGERKRTLCKGLELTSVPILEKVEPLKKITGKKLLKPDLIDSRFSITEKAFSLISEENNYVRKRAGQKAISLMYAPHMIISPKYCIFSNQDFVIPDTQVGISVSKEEENLLRALSIFLNSTIFRYYTFFNSASWGVGRSKFTPKDVKNVPIPNFTKEQVEQLAELQEYLAEAENIGTSSSTELQEKLDKEIKRVLKLPSSLSILANDFINIKLTLHSKNKVNVLAARIPSKDELQSYGECLRNELDNFIGENKTRHKISFKCTKYLILCIVEIVSSTTHIDVSISSINENTEFKEILEKLEQRFSQNLYIQRNLYIVESSTIYMFKLPQLINWTKSQALKDSDDIIAEVLTNNVNSNEVAS